MSQTSGIQILCKLGEGSYGEVYKARDTKTNLIFAVKVVRFQEEEQGVSSTTLRELSILQKLNHENIIKLQHYKFQMEASDPRMELYFDYMDDDLSKFLRRNKNNSPSDIKNIMYQIVLGVDYMHSEKVFHRDLKPQNILIDKQKNVKIADFGLGRILGNRLGTMSKEIETLWYRAPELLLGNIRYTLAVDIWSIGCIFYELAEDRILFRTESEIGQIMEIMSQQGTPRLQEWKQITDLPFLQSNSSLIKPTFPKFQKIERKYQNLERSGIDLLESMLLMNPKSRISIGEIRRHPYFCSM